MVNIETDLSIRGGVVEYVILFILGAFLSVCSIVNYLTFLSTKSPMPLGGRIVQGSGLYWVILGIFALSSGEVVFSVILVIIGTLFLASASHILRNSRKRNN